MRTDIGLNDGPKMAVAGTLTQLQADLAVLQFKVHAYHWIVTGVNFGPLHSFFGELYEALDGRLDDTAERIRILGSSPLVNFASILKMAKIKEEQKAAKPDKQILLSILTDFESVIKQLRAGVDSTAKAGDSGTSDFLTGMMEAMEKEAWKLRAHVE